MDKTPDSLSFAEKPAAHRHDLLDFGSMADTQKITDLVRLPKLTKKVFGHDYVHNNRIPSF